MVISQLLEEYEVKRKDLVSYHTQARQILDRLDTINLQHVPRSANKMAGTLANLTTTLAQGTKEDMTTPICGKWVVTPSEEESAQEINVVFVYEAQKEDWRQSLIDYPKASTRFLYYNDTILMLLPWLVDKVFRQRGSTKSSGGSSLGVCSAHQSRPKLCESIKRMEYYWPTVVHNCIHFVKRCDECQFHANFIHQPPEPLHPTVVS